MTTIPFDEIVPGATVRLVELDNTPNLSISDIIKHVMAKDFRGASKVWANLSNEKKKEVWPNETHFQFPGQGQSRQPVTTFQGALKLVMFLSGDKAAFHRAAMVKILERYHGGDASLTDEIEANAQSTAPMAQLARASLAAEMAPAQNEMSLTHKRKLEELELTKQEVEINSKRLANVTTERENETKRLANITTEREHLKEITTSYRDLCEDKVMDERARLILKDNFLNMAMLQAQAPTTRGLLTNGGSKMNTPISLSMVGAEMRLKIPPNELISIGMELKKRYTKKHGKEPTKHDQLCGGRMTKVNSYMESDRDLMEEVLRCHAAESD